MSKRFLKLVAVCLLVGSLSNSVFATTRDGRGGFLAAFRRAVVQILDDYGWPKP
jgi:hypothetical protein